MKILTSSFVVLMTVSSAYAWSGEPGPAKAEGYRTGDATNTWLELQRSGNQASPHSQPISGPVMQRSYERYLKSFERPIPDKFDRYDRK